MDFVTLSLVAANLYCASAQAAAHGDAESRLWRRSAVDWRSAVDRGQSFIDMSEYVLVQVLVSNLTGTIALCAFARLLRYATLFRPWRRLFRIYSTMGIVFIVALACFALPYFSIAMYLALLVYNMNCRTSTVRYDVSHGLWKDVGQTINLSSV